MNKVYWMQVEGESSWFVSFFVERDMEAIQKIYKKKGPK